MRTTPTWPRRQVQPRAPGWLALCALIIAGVLGSSMSVAWADHHEQNASGHLFTTRDAECMWMHVHISKPSNNVNEMRFRPYILTRGTMDHARRSWAPHLGWYDQQCAETGHQAPPFTMHIAEHLAVWAHWLNNWVWCNNGPEIVNSNFSHEIVTSWWWWAFPCQDIADSAWFFNRGYYRADMSVGTVERTIQTPWLYAAGP